tara:strand:+ start:12317 stop:12799 length:483 start_codon:yes stop_codon:yes gene_type:complete
MTIDHSDYKTKWEYLCENLTKEGDVVDKYDAYSCCPLCSTEYTEVEHPKYKYGDEPQLQDVDVEYNQWTLRCPDCGFEIGYEHTIVATHVKIPDEVPAHLVALPYDFVSDETDPIGLGCPCKNLTICNCIDDNDDETPQDGFVLNGWKFSRKTGWEYPQR